MSENKETAEIYTKGLPVEMSITGINTMIKLFLVSSGCDMEVLRKNFIECQEEDTIGERLVRTIIAQAILTMEREQAEELLMGEQNG